MKLVTDIWPKTRQTVTQSTARLMLLRHLRILENTVIARLELDTLDIWNRELLLLKKIANLI